MSKFTDAVRDTMISYFNIGDQPTEAQFAVLITAIQEGIDEHDHTGVAGGDGMQFATLGIGKVPTLFLDILGTQQDAIQTLARLAAKDAGGNLKAFDIRVTAGTPEILLTTAAVGPDPRLSLSVGGVAAQVTLLTNGYLGVGVAGPDYRLDTYDNRVDNFVGRFQNDGDNVDRHVLILQGGADNGATVGTTYYTYFLDGDGDVTGTLRTVDGVFVLSDVSDEARKVNVVDTKLNGLDIVNGLRVRDYNWKANPKAPAMTSFVAQEAREVYPNMIGEALDGTLMTSRSTLIPILTKAIQELDARLTRGGL